MVYFYTIKSFCIKHEQRKSTAPNSVIIPYTIQLVNKTIKNKESATEDSLDFTQMCIPRCRHVQLNKDTLNKGIFFIKKCIK